MTNFFKTAKPVSEPKPTLKKANKHRTVAMKGVKEHAAICAAIKALEGLKAAYEAPIKAQATEEFLNVGIKTHRRPDNFISVEGIAQIGSELRKRSSNSPLSEAEVTALEEVGIEVETVETQAQRYVINPDYMNNQALLEDVSKMLGKVKGLPEDFIQVQERQTKSIVGDDTLTAVFAKAETREALEVLMPIVTVIAAKPTMKGEDGVQVALDIVKGLLAGDDARQSAQAGDDLRSQLAASLKAA